MRVDKTSDSLKRFSKGSRMVVLFFFRRHTHTHNRRRIWLSSWLPALLGEKTILPFSSYVRRPPGARGGRRPRREEGKRECLLFLAFCTTEGAFFLFLFWDGPPQQRKKKRRRRKKRRFLMLTSSVPFPKAKTLELPDRYRNAHCQIFL